MKNLQEGHKQKTRNAPKKSIQPIKKKTQYTATPKKICPSLPSTSPPSSPPSQKELLHHTPPRTLSSPRKASPLRGPCQNLSDPRPALKRQENACTQTLIPFLQPPSFCCTHCCTRNSCMRSDHHSKQPRRLAHQLHSTTDNEEKITSTHLAKHHRQDSTQMTDTG